MNWIADSTECWGVDMWIVWNALRTWHKLCFMLSMIMGIVKSWGYWHSMVCVCCVCC
jgi:hypothetical protein